MYNDPRWLRLRRAMPCALGVALFGCDAVVSLDPIVSDTDAVPVPELLGDWTSNDTLVYRVTADSSRPAVYVASVIGALAETDTLLTGVRFELRATRINERLLVEATPSDADSLIGRAVARYANLLRSGYVHAVVTLDHDSLLVSAFEVAPVRDAIASRVCPAADGVTLLRTGGMGDRDVILGGAPGDLRRTMECFMTRPGVLADTETLRRPRATVGGAR